MNVLKNPRYSTTILKERPYDSPNGSDDVLLSMSFYCCQMCPFTLCFLLGNKENGW